MKRTSLESKNEQLTVFIADIYGNDPSIISVPPCGLSTLNYLINYAVVSRHSGGPFVAP